MSILSNKRFFWLEHETIRAGSPTGTKLYDKTAELSRPPPLVVPIVTLFWFSKY